MRSKIEEIGDVGRTYGANLSDAEINSAGDLLKRGYLEGAAHSGRQPGRQNEKCQEGTDAGDRSARQMAGRIDQAKGMGAMISH